MERREKYKVITAAMPAIVFLIGWLDGRAADTNAPASSQPVVAIAAPTLIEVEVRFVEIEQEMLKTVNKAESNRPPTSPLADLGVSTVLTQELSLVLHALEQWHSVNILSAPKVTTEAGKEAEIKMVKEIRYPTAYETQVVVVDKKTGNIRLLASNEVAAASNTVMTAIGIPKFETCETGVILKVTPTLESDGRTIHLALNPKVVELVDWIDYGLTMWYPDKSVHETHMY